MSPAALRANVVSVDWLCVASRTAATSEPRYVRVVVATTGLAVVMTDPEIAAVVWVLAIVASRPDA